MKRRQIHHSSFTVIMNAVIIVAAGSGKRFGGGTPKQFLEIGGKPVLIYTLEKFERCAAIDEIVVVLAESEIAGFERKIRQYNLKKISKIVKGGDSRAASVLNGLNEIDAEKTEIVAVHDGARPLVSIEEIAATVEKARETGAACLVARVTDTIKEVGGSVILRTVDREKLRRALTPQAFRTAILRKAFAENEIGETATDECALVEKIGIEIAFVEGSARNIKITQPDDLKIAEIFLKDYQAD